MKKFEYRVLPIVIKDIDKLSNTLRSHLIENMEKFV